MEGEFEEPQEWEESTVGKLDVWVASRAVMTACLGTLAVACVSPSPGVALPEVPRTRAALGLASLDATSAVARVQRMSATEGWVGVIHVRGANGPTVHYLSDGIGKGGAVGIKWVFYLPEVPSDVLLVSRKRERREPGLRVGRQTRDLAEESSPPTHAARMTHQPRWWGVVAERGVLVRAESGVGRLPHWAAAITGNWLAEP